MVLLLRAVVRLDSGRRTCAKVVWCESLAGREPRDVGRQARRVVGKLEMFIYKQWCYSDYEKKDAPWYRYRAICVDLVMPLNAGIKSSLSRTPGK